MAYIANNGFRFIERGNSNFPISFITDENKNNVTIFIDDLIINFCNGKYINCDVLPF